MPKEQPRMSEHNPCATSSKNAKDKSNSSTLLAMRDGKDADSSSGRGSHCSSEKDSGYSDGSDWQQTDAEDHHAIKRQPRGSDCTETTQSSKNQDLGQGKPGNPVLMPTGHELPPIYVIKNMVLKKSDVIQKRGQLLWETNTPGVPHMILCQQPSLVPSTVQLHKSLSKKSSVTGKKMKSTYLPIFNSYPRIAPHPSKKPPDKSSSNGASQTVSKRVCTEHKNEQTPLTRSLREQHLSEQHLNKQPKLAVSACGQPNPSSTRDSPSSSCSDTGSTSVTSGHSNPSSSSSSSPTAKGLKSSSSTRHRRFLNTAEILRQSGLLDITLRTKELLQQSTATERDIAQLRQHADLLCQAAGGPGCGPNGIAAWERVHRAMAESSSYPNLKLLQNLQLPSHPDSAGQAVIVDAGDSVRPLAADVPSPRLLTTLLDPNQNCPVSQQSRIEQNGRLEAEKNSEKVTLMPPDSSTG